MKRIIALLLAAILLLSVLPLAGAYGTEQRNTGVRDELCTALSEQALAYYL